ncbi:MAG: hypothetical protein DMG58_09525 [Acidobacteria bacterium]|nr:MAG: hypothetical protein DMG58_09525 [Acidobacteriota bacterium]
MSSWINARRLTAVFCLALLLVATLIPAGYGLPYAILVPLWLFLAAVVLITIHSGREVCQLPWFFVGRTLSSRAPPILSTL